MAREAMLAVGLGAAAGLLFLSLMSGSLLAILLVNLTQLPLFLAGLWLGPKAALIAGAAGTLGTLSATSFSGGLLFLAAYAAPVALLSWQGLRWRRDEAGSVWWYPAGHLVAWLVGMGLVGLGLVALLAAGEPGGLEGAVGGVLEQQMTVLFGAGPDAAQARDVAAAMAGLFPGFATATWLVMTAVNGTLAQRLLVWWRKNRRPTPSMVEVELPGWIPIAFAAALAAAVFLPATLGYLGRNALPVLALGFFVAGLAVVHALARRFNIGTPLLATVYVLILFVWPAAVAVAALGLIEQWAGLRRRLATGGGE
jgi:hypothetical protein